MFDAVVADVLKRPFIMFGMAGLLMLIALAVTSNSPRSAAWARIGFGCTDQSTSSPPAARCILRCRRQVLSVEQYIYVSLLIAVILTNPIGRS
jgi:sulfoxide reductase heme-binding subunit YedZ